MIHIFTRAYNEEKMLCRCIDSILGQTNGDIRYYLVDNGSKDGTKKSIIDYSIKDKRIKPFYFQNNRSGIIGEFLNLIYKDSKKCDYFCMLDADDEYAPDFLERMLRFMQENNLEVAACGSDFIDTDTNNLLGVRKLEQNLILVGDGFDKYFPQYYQFMRTIWGKVYSLSALRRCNFDSVNISYGADTLFAMEAFRNANRVGILAESLHKYYVSPKSVSYQFDKRRTKSDRILFDAANDFLNLKCGRVSNKNLGFLRIVYFNAIKDTLNVLLNAQISVSEKLENLLDIFQSQHTQELIKWQGAESEKRKLFSQVASWVLSKKEVRSRTGLNIAADLLANMDIYPSQIDGWQKEWVFILLTKIRDSRVEMGNASRVDSQIISVVSTSAYFAELEAGFLCYFRDIVFSVLQNDEIKALKQIEVLIVKGTDIPDKYIEEFLTLALNLSAKMECPDYFIYFKKLQISVLIDLSRIDEATEEFADWDEVLPDDMEFIELKKRLGR